MRKYIGILYFFFMIFLYYMTKNNNIFLLTVSFSLVAIFMNLFLAFDYKSALKQYHKQENYYLRDKIFKCYLLMTFIVMLFLGIFAYLLGSIMDIDKLNIINLIAVSFLLNSIFVKIMSSYLEVVGYKKIGTNLNEIFFLITVVIDIIGVILSFKVFKLNDYWGVMFIYLGGIIAFIFVFLTLFFTIFRKHNKNIIKNKEKIRINYLKEYGKVFIKKDSAMLVLKIIKPFYIYFSIIILYYVLMNKYNYNYYDVGRMITDTYFFGIIVIYVIYLIIKSLYISKVNSLIVELKNKSVKAESMFNNLINKVVSFLLRICVVLSVISGPFNYLLFGNNYNIIFYLVPLLFFYLLYDIIVDVSLACNENKRVLGVIFSGILVKMIFEIELVATMYRMGYSLVFGSIMSNILGYIISMIVGLFFIQRKLKISFLNNFNTILNIIYDNILLCIVLVLFTLIVKVDTNTLGSSILVIVFYLMVTGAYLLLEKRIKKFRNDS